MTIAVIDTGIKVTRSNFAAASSNPRFRFNYVYGNADVSHTSAANDHGTHVSYIAAGYGSTVKGIAYNAQIISVQVFEGSSAPWSTMLGAPKDCAYLDVDCVNMSLGSDCSFTASDADTERMYKLLYEHGVSALAAADNNNISGSGNTFSFSQAPTTNPDNGIVSSHSSHL